MQGDHSEVRTRRTHSLGALRNVFRFAYRVPQGGTGLWNVTGEGSVIKEQARLRLASLRDAPTFGIVCWGPAAFSRDPS